MAVDYQNIPFVAARWFTKTEGRDVRKLVLHSMEAAEKGTTAEAVAQYFATTEKKVSSHYCVDSDSIVQCCQTKDVAYGAPGANHDGVQIELAGFARQTRAEWLDDYSLLMLSLAAGLCAQVLCPKHEVPVLYATAGVMKVRPAAAGITLHRDVSAAFKLSTHTDPGAGFPMALFLELIRAQM